jgi:hypothetical protein
MSSTKEKTETKKANKEEIQLLATAKALLLLCEDYVPYQNRNCKVEKKNKKTLAAAWDLLESLDPDFRKPEAEKGDADPE